MGDILEEADEDRTDTAGETTVTDVRTDSEDRTETEEEQAVNNSLSVVVDYVEDLYPNGLP